MYKWWKILEQMRQWVAARRAVQRMALLVVAPALMLAGCSSEQLTRFQQGLTNFQTGVTSVNQTIAEISPQLLQNCNTLLSFTDLLAPFAAGSKYNADYQAAVSVISTYCQAPPVTNIAGTVALTAQAAANAKAAYNKAKNGPDMDNKELTSLIEGLLGLVPVFYPPAAPVVLVITKALPWVIAAGPVVRALVEEGVPAYEAAKEKAPKLAEAISELAAIVPMTNYSEADDRAPSKHVENVARTVIGFPRMTFEQELDWMNKSVPPNDSRFGGA